MVRTDAAASRQTRVSEGADRCPGQRGDWPDRNRTRARRRTGRGVRRLGCDGATGSMEAILTASS